MRRPALATLLLLTLPALAGCLTGDGSAPGAELEGNGSRLIDLGLTYAPALVVPDSGDVSEPMIAIDSEGRIFLSAPTGVPSTSPLWRSVDGGKTFERLEPNPTMRLGGGDTSIAIGPNDEIYLTDLWAGSSTMLVSHDHGDTWFASPIASQVPYHDREWNTVDAQGRAYYLARVFTPGVAATVSRSDDGGRTWVHAGVAWAHALGGEANQGRQDGNLINNPKTDEIAVAYTCGQSSVCLSRSGDAGATWTPAVAATGSGSPRNIFPAVAADTAGNWYVSWAERAGDDTHVWMTWSADGDAWSEPVQVTSGEGVRLFPWMVAGDEGRVSLTWYGTDTRGDNNDPTAMKDAQWRVYAATSLDATSATPTFDVRAITPQPIKTGTVSTGGFGGSADRSLGDFFANAVDPTTGYVHYAFNQVVDGERSMVHLQQTGGPSLYVDGKRPVWGAGGSDAADDSGDAAALPAPAGASTGAEDLTAALPLR